jgi:hypothetical protein
MHITRWLAVLTALVLILTCFFPWVSIDRQSIVIGGFHATVTDYGKPGIIHSFISSLCILLLLLNRLWTIRTGFFVSTINIAWSIRNYFLLSACKAGICPQKLPALYLLVICSFLLTILIALSGISPKKLGQAPDQDAII